MAVCTPDLGNRGEIDSATTPKDRVPAARRQRELERQRMSETLAAAGGVKTRAAHRHADPHVHAQLKQHKL
jgi:hypothetical protein